MSDVPKYLPQLLGPSDFQVDGVDASVPRRGTINVIGGTVTDNPAQDRTDVSFGLELPDSIVAGDVFYFDGTSILAAAGPKTEGYVLTMTGGVPTWAESTGGGGGGGGGGGTMAAILATFEVWYDLADCTQAGTVTALPDQTTNGNDAIIPGGEEPTYAATDAAINNLPTMIFAGGTTKRVEVPDLGIGAEAFTVAFVSYCVAPSNPAVFTADDGNVESVPNGGGKWAISGDGTTTFLADPSINMTTPAVVIAVFNGDGTGKLYVNAKTPTTGLVTAGGAGTPDLTGVSFCLGHYKILEANAGFALDGPIAFWGVYKGALSNTDCGTLLDGLGALAGISIGA